jgi:hypothetical protein
VFSPCWARNSLLGPAGSSPSLRPEFPALGPIPCWARLPVRAGTAGNSGPSSRGKTQILLNRSLMSTVNRLPEGQQQHTHAPRQPARARSARRKMAASKLKPGWTEHQIPSQVPPSIRGRVAARPATDTPPAVVEVTLKPGWTEGQIPSQVPPSIREAVSGGSGGSPSSCDILIRGGTLVDGTGAEPYIADVAIQGTQILSIGPDLSHLKAEREVDARGHIVTPGWVDIHTHYDGQITWDPTLSPSTQHGVTTLMFGNCGVGFAPCRPESREKLIDVLEGVEDIPGSALHVGIQWSWETFPEYLATLSATQTACDFAVLLPHVPLRVFVMGERCDEVPTGEDLAAMRRLVAEAMQAGAIGFSTSRTLLHRDLHGTVIPGTYADRAELTALMAGMADGGGGLFEILVRI